MECSICLTAVLQEQKKTTACNHTFHAECLDRWTKDHATCPLCRHSLEHAPRLFNLTPLTDLFVAEEQEQADVPLSFWFSRNAYNAIPLIAVPLAFALHPEEYQPSESVNMSGNPQLIFNIPSSLPPVEQRPNATFYQRVVRRLSRSLADS
jgi:hypothetical protein